MSSTRLSIYDWISLEYTWVDKDVTEKMARKEIERRKVKQVAYLESQAV